ncbi:TPA: endonuclease [bacterium]|nr:endonuclease [bacterium]
MYGPQYWWPAETKFEMIVGAVLTQNTSWHNVSIAIDNLEKNGLFGLFSLIDADENLVKDLIKPIGFFNIKYNRLINLLEYFAEQGLDNPKFMYAPVYELRQELLSIKGIGRETSDSILLYAFGRPIFVVDAYTRRLFSRLGYGWMEKADYDEIQHFFMANLPMESIIYNEFHALIVRHCKELCKKNPICLECNLSCPMNK